MSFKYIPNALTIFRILIVPFFVMFFLGSGFMSRLISLALFFIGSITDFFDGYIARKYNYVTNFGKLIDPFADKILIISALLLLNNFYPDSIKFWMVIAIIFRDIFITLYRYILIRKKIVMKTSIFAKSKTLLQIIIIHIVLIYHTLYNDIAINSLYNFNYFIYVLMVICTLLTILTGIHYIIINSKKIR